MEWERQSRLRARIIRRWSFAITPARARIVRRFAGYWRWRRWWKVGVVARQRHWASWTVKRCATGSIATTRPGSEGLKSRRSPGRAPALSAAQMAKLKAVVLAGPDPAEHQVVRWRCVDLQAEVARRFAVEVHESTVGRWLHELGLTRLQPRPSHPRKIAEAEETFKKTSPAC
ncbi:MAG: hypothetical protein EPO10_27690 [Reyranella sp.]|nr:MAG: hypothetical protein EPO41_05305 [Reyranella sp.]TBR22932.1 MAG: hypothetical protein EPO10_27690 [Reyranella sp.]